MATTKQKVYTYPNMTLYGEYDLIGLAELQLSIVKGEVPEQLCYMDSDLVTYPIDRFGQTDTSSSEFLQHRYMLILNEVLRAQLELREREDTIMHDGVRIILEGKK